MSQLRPRSGYSHKPPSPSRAESQIASAPRFEDDNEWQYSYFETRPQHSNNNVDEFGFPNTPEQNTYEMEQYHNYNSQNPNAIYDDEKYARQILQEEMLSQNGYNHPPAQPHPTNVQESRNTISNAGKQSRRQRIDSIVNDPSVARQLRKRKKHRPWFIWTVSIAQVVLLCYSFVENSNITGNAIEPINQNPMIGPGAFALIRLGARFVPCMKQDTKLTGKSLACPATLNPSQVCSVKEICPLTSDVPNQWWRFITPIFLHGGIFHILMNLFFQLQTGTQLESEYGWRIIPIYMISGIFGFIFGANFSPQTMPSVGASGSLFGLLGCILIDLLQNWKIILKPWRSLFGIIITMIISFIIGLFPGIDNFSHIGGFIAGCLSAVVFLPTIHFGKWDKRWKFLARIVCAALICILFVGLLIGFYNGKAGEWCSWCKYFGCLPIGNLCDTFN